MCTKSGSRLNIKNKFFLAIMTFTFLFTPVLLFASEGQKEDVTHMMTMLVFQIGIIIFAAKAFGLLFEKLTLPSVLGELVAGIVIGPYLLGSLPLPGFHEGVFPLSVVTALPVSPELYGFATIASIVLLFSAGLETDFALFLRFSLAGAVLGIGGVIVSFVIGDYTAQYFISGNTGFMDPRCMFMGVLGTATSVGITARILSERRRMDSPEGVSIMAGAVIDDILGIIVLAVVLGITVSAKKGGASVDWASIGRIALRAVMVWLVFTAIGVVFARRISNFLKRFKSVAAFSVLSLGMAFVISGIFEKAGLALIVGAYVMGLSLSRTDLSFVIRDKLHMVELLLVPLFFTVMGMMVDPHIFASKEVLVFGLVYTVGAVIAKIVGCGLPALGLGFNARGALRIGLGMVPRGEVALIIAGIGISYGVLDSTEFGVAIMMTLLTTVVSPPLLNIVLKSEKRGTNKEFTVAEHVSTVYSFPSPYLTGLIENRVVEYLKDEGFFISMFHLENHVYRVAKDDIMFTMNVSPYVVDFQSEQGDVAFLKNVVFESLISLHTAIENLAPREATSDMKKDLVSAGRVNKQEIKKWLNPDCILMELKGTDSSQVIEELIDVLYESGEIDNKSEALSAVLERERNMSTGLSDGLAIPHAKVEHLHGIKIAVGFSKPGVDFSALDGKPCTMIVLILSPADEAASHLLLMSNITSLYAEEESRERIFRYYTSEGVYDFLTR